MTPPLTDAEYSSSARAALIAIARWLETPCNLLTADHQQQFIRMTADKVLPVVNSEPHLRGAAIKALDDLQTHDIETVQRERDRHRATATNLLDALKVQPLPRGIDRRKDRERLIALAEKAL